MRLSGEVVCFYERGFGFVVTEDRKEYYLHAKNVVNGLLPQKGDVVTFEVGAPHQPGRSPQAINAEVIPAMAARQ